MATGVGELKRRVAVLSRLAEVSVTLNSTLEIDRLLEFIIRTAAEVIDAEAASILLVDEHTNELRFAAATGADQNVLARIHVPLDASIAGAVFRERRPQIVPNVSQDPRHYGDVARQVQIEVRSLLGVPMQIKGRMTGVLETLNKRRGGFSEADVDTLSIVAAQAAVAIHNARLLEKLQKAYADLGELDRMKSAFIAIASHELRTPLHSLLGYADLLSEEGEGQLAQYAHGALESAQRMHRVINELTNLRTLEAGQLPLVREHIDARQLVQDAHDNIQELAVARSQRLLVEASESPLPVHVDRHRMLVVMMDLLDNALRFTPAGGEIRLRAFGKSGEVWLQVEDNGCGIPAGQEENIFKPFYQVEPHMTRRHAGLGMGLAIVRETVTLHGGRTWAESRGPGQGSVFTVVLPRIA
jgi:signal transduction histidine kinase